MLKYQTMFTKNRKYDIMYIVNVNIVHKFKSSDKGGKNVTKKDVLQPFEEAVQDAKKTLDELCKTCDSSQGFMPILKASSVLKETKDDLGKAKRIVNS